MASQEMSRREFFKFVRDGVAAVYKADAVRKLAFPFTAITSVDWGSGTSVHGCERLFTDTMSGAKAERPGLTQALEFMREGDVLVVWKLDRLGRSLKNLIEVVSKLSETGIGFRSLTESIDTTTSSGKLIFHIFGALAEFERDLIRERTAAGLVAARARGRKGGRPRAAALSDPKKVSLAMSLYSDKNNRIDDICATLRVSRSTLFRYMRRQKAVTNGPEFKDYVVQKLGKLNIQMRHSRVRKPNDNAHLERFNRTLQEECITIPRPEEKTLQEQLNNYLEYYNNERLHLGINCMTPAQCVAKVLT